MGTAHVSRQSVADVEDTIDAVKPDTICVELCPSRYQNIVNREAWNRLLALALLLVFIAGHNLCGAM